MTQLPAILKEEEDESYINEAGQCDTDIITRQHNSAVLTIAIGHIVEKVGYSCITLYYSIFKLFCASVSKYLTDAQNNLKGNWQFTNKTKQQIHLDLTPARVKLITYVIELKWTIVFKFLT